MFALNAGGNVTLPCVVDGFAKPDIAWVFYSSNSSIPPRKLKTADPSGSLSLRTIQHDSEGRYVCEVTNIGGNDTITYEIEVLEPPVIDKKIKEIRTLQRGAVRIECRLLQGKPKPVVRWFYQTPQGNKEMDAHSGEDHIILYNVTTKMSGTYRCEAHNSVGNDSHSTKIVVDYPPVFGPEDPNIEAKEADEITIHCSVVGEPTPKVTWFVNDTGIDTKRFSIDEFHNLT
ncbi:immunoglobulin superfamily member 10-like [Hyposmocoma kahamanoa]|uniref:immunoglobulin superfamily member 10-like n=1 Tax=Hyposmocoma kahamanoa TaxID=1477025 RepID=UPI000E6D8C7B|nr:immunoglobulin superfamily member 10-like [Hyposmocoma kahamanoa]